MKVVSFIIVITTCYGATQPVLSSALQHNKVVAVLMLIVLS